MAHKKKHSTPVPPANQPQGGPQVGADISGQAATGGGSPFQDQDAKRRLGGFESAGEHARQQPSALNDGQQHSR
jgi:hypothetical protein